MANIVSKIVLTGGPCAGKTTALTNLEENLIEKGYHVIIISESATELIKAGIKPFGKNHVELMDFQRIILDVQLSKEQLYEAAAQYLPEGECVVIYDRGVMDNKAYIGSEAFSKLLKEKELKEIELMDHYDMIMHLTSAALGAEDFYTLENNVARTETLEEARDLDKRTLDAWAGHSNLKIFTNETTFQDKMDNVLEAVYDQLNKPISIRNQRKYLIDLDASDLSFLNDDNSTEIEINQTYIKLNDYETRVRMRTLKNMSTYYLTVQKKKGNGQSRVITHKKITEKDYLKLLETEQLGTVQKRRICFSANNQYFRLDIFEDNTALLEVDSKIGTKINVPKEFNVIKEVTNSKKYDNANFERAKLWVLGGK